MKLKKTADTLDPICKWGNRGSARLYQQAWGCSAVGFDLTPKLLPLYTRVWFQGCQLSPGREHLGVLPAEFLEPLGKLPRVLSWPRNTLNHLAIPRFSVLPTFAALLTVFPPTFEGLGSSEDANSGLGRIPVMWFESGASAHSADCYLYLPDGAGTVPRCRMPQSLYLRDPRPSC